MSKRLIWIVENMVKESSYISLVNEIEKQGYELIKVNGDFKKDDLKNIPSDASIITTGSIEMCKLFKETLPNHSPVTFSTFENYLCSKYYPYFEEFLFNDQYIFLPLKSLNRRFWSIYGLYGKDSNIFVRPDSGDKPFKAGLIDAQDWSNFYESMKHIDNDLILVSTPKNIVGEWRFVVTEEKEILAVSSYQYQGLTTRIPSAPKKATDLIYKLLDVGYYPDPVFCFDVCEDSDGDFWLLELTSFSSAGLYACKMENIVKRVSEISMNKL